MAACRSCIDLRKKCPGAHLSTRQIRPLACYSPPDGPIDPESSGSHDRSFSTVLGETDVSLRPHESRSVLCTHRTRLWFARTATRSSSSARASSSSTRIVSSASRDVAPLAAQPERPSEAISVAVPTRVAAAAAAATPPARVRCSPRRARAAVAKPRFRSAPAAPSRSIAATASLLDAHSIGPQGHKTELTEPGERSPGS